MWNPGAFSNHSKTCRRGWYLVTRIQWVGSEMRPSKSYDERLAICVGKTASRNDTLRLRPNASQPERGEQNKLAEHDESTGTWLSEFTSQHWNNLSVCLLSALDCHLLRAPANLCGLVSIMSLWCLNRRGHSSCVSKDPSCINFHTQDGLEA